MEFSKRLTKWYLQNERDLPWRKAHEPYQIWLSEIMLQQTRIEQGLPYYNKFIETYPSVFDLARASSEEVLKLWQGLGYYSRARNLHETARYVAYELDGKFPANYRDLKKLKGVGDYTASAIASICYSEPVAVVDGNVYRFLSRLFGVETPINTTHGNKEFKALATELLDRQDPGTYNQALMEFGALQCKPQNPTCTTCPFNDKCVALKDDRIGDLPVKLKKVVVRKRFFNYLVFDLANNKTMLEKRTGKGIWNGLYQFPLIESADLINEEELIIRNDFQAITGDTEYSVELFNDTPVIHKLSHQHLYTRFWLINSTATRNDSIHMKTLVKYPVPVLIENFLNDYLPDEYK